MTCRPKINQHQHIIPHLIGLTHTISFLKINDKKIIHGSSLEVSKYKMRPVGNMQIRLYTSYEIKLPTNGFEENFILRIMDICFLITEK